MNQLFVKSTLCCKKKKHDYFDIWLMYEHLLWGNKSDTPESQGWGANKGLGAIRFSHSWVLDLSDSPETAKRNHLHMSCKRKCVHSDLKTLDWGLVSSLSPGGGAAPREEERCWRPLQRQTWSMWVIFTFLITTVTKKRFSFLFHTCKCLDL